jgi:hypothetical protein
MVQLNDTFRWRPKGPNDYWELGDGSGHTVTELFNLLKARKFSCNTRGRARLCELYVRYQRGLLSYEGLPLSELELYATQRGLPLIPTADGRELITTGMLKARLEHADDNATFERLAYLPPEPRTKIFVLYFNALDRSSPRYISKYQPPLTLVSRQTRRESLPLFYGCCSFSMHVIYGVVRGHPTTAFNIATDKFVAATAQNFACIRKLRLTFPTFGGDFSGKVYIKPDLTNNDDPLRGYSFQAYLNENLQNTSTCLSELRAKTKAIAARPGTTNLRVSNIKDLGMVLGNHLKNPFT